jgi:hypothetical protein
MYQECTLAKASVHPRTGTKRSSESEHVLGNESDEEYNNNNNIYRNPLNPGAAPKARNSLKRRRF